MTSLDEFVAERQAKRRRCWADGLPDEVVDEILASRAGKHTVSRWLQATGYADASPAKVEPLIRRREEADDRTG